jgi:hypothetical protein
MSYPCLCLWAEQNSWLVVASSFFSLLWLHSLCVVLGCGLAAPPSVLAGERIVLAGEKDTLQLG